MKYKSPKKPGDLISKVNSAKKSESMVFPMKVPKFNPLPKYTFGSSTKATTLPMRPGSLMPTKQPAGLKTVPKRKKKASKGKHKKNWIAGAIKHPGALHRELGIKPGKKIPAKTLAHAASKGGKLGRRARLAETLKGMHHKKNNDHDADDKKMKKHSGKHSVHHKKTTHCKGC